MLKDTKISVVIPVKNGADTLDACLNGILTQTVEVEEIVVIDSGSTDTSLDIIGRYPKTRIIRIDPASFNHGETRNLGVREAVGDLVLFTVQDARAKDDQWIKHLLEGFSGEKTVAVCGSQVVNRDISTNPVEWFRPQSLPKIAFYDYPPGKYETIEAQEKRKAGSWDNVSAMYKRDVLKKVPFQKAIYGEDVFWAVDALKAGYRIAYNPAARVYHFHWYDYDMHRKRTVCTLLLRYMAFGTKQGGGSYSMYNIIARYLYRILNEPGLTWSERIYWLRYNYNAVRGQSAGLKLFHRAVKNGTDALTDLHERYCGTPPIPTKNVLVSIHEQK